MAKGFKHGAGGGAPLNFKVVGNPQPTNPKENTIWLNTNIDITSWYFSPTQPEDMKQGGVWFSTGTSSVVAFSATKKNPVMVYPLSANQYIDGALVAVTAQIYQDGEWVDWFAYLYHLGDTCDDLTGGWQARGWAISSSFQKITPSLTFSDDGMTVSVNNTLTTSPYQASGVVECIKDIDLTNFNTLTIDCSVTHSYSDTQGFSPVQLVVTGRTGTYVNSNRQAVEVVWAEGNASNESRTVSLDISGCSGTWDVVLALGAKNNKKTTVTVHGLWLS